MEAGFKAVSFIRCGFIEVTWKTAKWTFFDVDNNERMFPEGLLSASIIDEALCEKCRLTRRWKFDEASSGINCGGPKGGEDSSDIQMWSDLLTLNDLEWDRLSWEPRDHVYSTPNRSENVSMGGLGASSAGDEVDVRQSSFLAGHQPQH